MVASFTRTTLLLVWSICLVGKKFYSWGFQSEELIIDCKNVVCEDIECEGILLPMGSADGCCDYCMPFLEEGSLCDKLLNTVPITGRPVCGPNLICRNNETDAVPKCRPRLSKCVYEQNQYDNQLSQGVFTNGLNRPRCDDLGLYSGFQCSLTSMCFCINENKTRIFGDTVQNAIPQHECKCSRYRTDYKRESIDDPYKLRCTPTGGYAAIQCFDDGCFCVDNDGVSLSRMKTPKNKLVDLPCYTGLNYIDISATCQGHREQLISYYRKENMLTTYLPSCGLDYNYEAVQHKDDRSFCADNKNNKLEHYEVMRASSLGKNMNCHCARNRALNMTSGTIPPKCCPNGNYYPWQCTGRLCFCVDQNGIQTSEDTLYLFVQNLQCYSDTPCYTEDVS